MSEHERDAEPACGEAAPGEAGPQHTLTRRAAAVVATGAALGLLEAARGSAALAQATTPPERNQRPKKGDRLVFASGANAGKEITPDLLPEGGPQVLAWPKDPASGTVRDGSRLNQVLVVRLGEDGLDEATRARSAGGIVAYSATCTHAQCPVTEWLKDREILHCPCHNSEYDPRRGAQVVNGPAPRNLPPLPVSLDGSTLVVAEPFIGRVGLGPQT